VSGLLALGGAVVVVLAIVGVLLVSVGVDPLVAAQALWNGAFGTTRSVGETLVRATPLLLIAITLIPSLRAGLYNIGAPGQMGFGALAATVIALQGAALPAVVLVPLCAVGGCLAGMAAAFVPGVLKARFNAN